MSKLTFPTMAERAIQAFHTRQYPSLAKACHAMGASTEKVWGARVAIEWTFEDDTTVRSTGRGRAHQYEALLP